MAVYLDHNATTPLDERVLAAMLPFLQRFHGNPSALYREGRLVRSAIDSAREQVAALVDAAPGQVVFTSGGTEANNQALLNLPAATQLAISAVEHPSITEAAAFLYPNSPVSYLPVDTNGQVIGEFIDQLPRQKIGLVSIMLANNETGVIQPVADYAPPLRDRGIFIHTDAVQAAGKIPVSFRTLGVHLLTLSSHKIYGPKGCGALVFDHCLAVKPMLVGGGQEHNYRAGTENVAAIVGFGKAAELAKQELDRRYQHVLRLREQLEHGLANLPHVTLFAKDAPRLPNTVQFGLAQTDGEMLLMKLDRLGIAVASGSACASGSGQPSPVLLAMGIGPTLAKSAVRISLGKDNTAADIQCFLDALRQLSISA
jgi:cysteine desulfurase